LAGEMMVAAKPFIERNIHPSIICKAYYKALEEGIRILEGLAVTIDINDDA
jgi:T-complex protein 1 subunit gamma